MVGTITKIVDTALFILGKIFLYYTIQLNIMIKTRIASQWDAYWVGFALFLLGVILLLAGIRLSRFFIAFGWGIIVLVTSVKLFSILKTTVAAGVTGYREEQRNGR
jgi:hypothetical protein